MNAYLMRVVVDVLSGEVPRAEGDGGSCGVFDWPRLDINPISNGLIASTTGPMSAAHQRTKQAVW